MLTRLAIRNFKRFRDVSIELGEPVVFVGPNNSGKSTALQALALWELGIRRLVERHAEGSTARERVGVTINRKDVLAAPVPDARLLWRDLHISRGLTHGGKRKTQPIRIEIVVEGVSGGAPWSAGLEFEYANEESFVVRPVREVGQDETPSTKASRTLIAAEASDVRLALLQPLSGLASEEFRKERGEVNVLMGQGRTAEVLRNLCHQVATVDPTGWLTIVQRMRSLFGVELDAPVYLPERGELRMTYRELADDAPTLDLSAAGRGLQQTLMLLAFLMANPGVVVLLDEPDAHLEVLRQRQNYREITALARELGSQIVATSHSEVVLNEAADRDVLVAFTGRPHRIDDRGRTQLGKALREIGFDQYLLAEERGWVLYLEGATDLAILQSLAATLAHPAARELDRPFVHYVANQPPGAQRHFHALRDATDDLVGFALFDRLDRPLPEDEHLGLRQWPRREIENYVGLPEALVAFADAEALRQTAGPLFAPALRKTWREAMEATITDFVPPVALRDRSASWWRDVKMSDEFLDQLFPAFHARLGLPNAMNKSDYHRLAPFVPRELIGAEVTGVLDALVAVAMRARPVADDDR